MKSLNISNIDSRPALSKLPVSKTDRSGWLFNPTISGIEEIDNLLR